MCACVWLVESATQAHVFLCVCMCVLAAHDKLLWAICWLGCNGGSHLACCVGLCCCGSACVPRCGALIQGLPVLSSYFIGIFGRGAVCSFRGRGCTPDASFTTTAAASREW